MRLVAVWWCYRIVQMAFLVITVMSAAFSERLSFGEENQTRASCSAALTSRQVEPPSLSKVVLSCGIRSMDGLLCHWNHENLICLSLSLSRTRPRPLRVWKHTWYFLAWIPVLFFSWSLGVGCVPMWREWQNDPVVWAIGPRRVVRLQVMVSGSCFEAVTFLRHELPKNECCVWEGRAHCDFVCVAVI